MPAADPLVESQGRALIRHGSALSLLTLVSRLLGLAREMTKAAFLGTTALSDAYSVAFMIPNLFRRLFAEGSIAVAFIPTFKEYLLENSQGDMKEFLSAILTFLTFFVTLTVMGGIILCPLVIRFFGMEEFSETVLLTRLMFPFLAFISLAAFFQGILNSLKIFIPSGFAPILLNVITILSAYLLSPYMANPARAMAFGVLLGGFLCAAIQLPFVIRHKMKIRFFFTSLKRAMENPGTKKVLRLIGPTIIGMAAYQLNDLVSTALAGNAGEGVVSSLQYSLRLQELILGVFAVSIGTVLLPDLAEYAKSGRWDVYNQRLAQAMDIIALICIPITFYALSQGETLIRLLFQTRTFDEESVALTLRAFTFHMPGLYFIALNRVLAPAFYAQSDTKSPTLAGIISFGVNISLAALLVSPYRGGGIALALSIASAVNTAVLLYFLKRNPAIEVGRTLLRSLSYMAKMGVFSALAVVPVLLISPFMLGLFAGRGRLVSQGLPLLLNGLVFALGGLVLLGLSGDRMFKGLLGFFRRRGR
ncbi:MAG: murein biosynthesis integral membrane protein MurJ [Treponema sp.]|nr:murein biosynthesis integral membrane protein MurJ [Treponema sp.]